MKSLFSCFFIFCIYSAALAQGVGVGTTTPNASAILDINSANKGVALPTVSDAARDAIASPKEGLLIFNSTTKNLNLYKNGNWYELNAGTCVPQPTASNAGPDQTVNGTSTTLAANTALSGTASWSLISGAGGTITTPSSPTSNFTGVLGTGYTLRWTITTPCTTSSDDVVINFAAPSCVDNIKNGTETDIDCGGGTCPTCANGKLCNAGSDCQSGVCSAGICATPSCVDNIKNGSETDIDCGGATCPKCANGKLCIVNSDCLSGVCSGGGICAAPSCSDNIKDGAETDIDCGGPTCPKCANGKLCLVSSDCQSGVCSAGVCATPSCSDNIKNGSETDIDCGGACPKCANGKLCNAGSDCQSGVCSAGTCAAPSCVDLIKNGTETDVDCGGATCPKCTTGKLCLVNSDCVSNICSAGHCN